MFSLAFKRILHTKFISAVTVFSISLSFVIFILLSSTLEHYAEHLLKRTKGDILVAGRQGANVDLIMSSLYFRQGQQTFIKASDLNELHTTAQKCGLFNMYSARGNPICGTDLDYFDIRQLQLNQGSFFTKIGECVIGAEIAKSMQLSVGDKVISDPTNIFDPGGSIPVQLTVNGILKRTNSADDKVLFTSLKTAWTIHGLGHSHLANTKGPDLSVKYVVFTPETLKDFHFHGDITDYPLTSALFLPASEKGATLLMAQSQKNQNINVIRPEAGLRHFLNILFQLKQLFTSILSLVLLLLILFFSLLIYLHVKLRKNERILFARLGTEKAFFKRLICAEWTLLLFSGVILGGVASLLLQPFMQQIFDQITKG
jgi:putative ABC transport system permease protein